MSTDMNMLELQTAINPVTIVQKVKLDPAKHLLSNIVDGSSYQQGEKYIFDISALDQILKETTSAIQAESDEASDIASKYETSVTKYRNLWGSIPTIEDYFEMDAITDAEEVERAFYKASENLGW